MVRTPQGEHSPRLFDRTVDFEYSYSVHMSRLQIRSLEVLRLQRHGVHVPVEGEHHRAVGRRLEQPAPVLGHHALGLSVVQFPGFHACPVADENGQAGLRGPVLPLAVRAAAAGPPRHGRNQHLRALADQHFGDVVLVGVGADQDAGLDAVAGQGAIFQPGLDQASAPPRALILR